MNWSNWIYLGAGLLLGIGVRGLFARSANTTSSQSVVVPGEQEHTSQLLQQLQQTQLAYEMAREMSQFKAGFLARTTHELRSPLNGLIGLHQLILSDLCEDPAEEREFIGQAHERALKLLHLMDEILNVAKTEHGNNKLDIQPQSLGDILQEVYKLTYMLAVDRNFKLQILPPDPAIHVLADPRWLRQILLNLVDTTIAQMQEGSIYISAKLAPNSNDVYIWLDLPNHALVKSESIDLLKIADESSLIDQRTKGLSPSMKLLLNQKLLAVMGGRLEIIPSPESLTAEQLTRLQLSIPLAIPEAELL
ncbi:sensor histidine kinase [Anabaena subtropica]|uniref:histidine kinase n=1 Tax=Anabaena subtropica FACHB-260 TaxID=2692884 RepID=A0ABR8CNR8_9NOST|nr:HAMP domain-containing sensor histidine kinase [Anabaena subtropica]MBD2344009.1 HAMP domain-containing histidine kinase [Anabaena subtropica FACHB-260]